METIKGYKGFKKDLKCRDFQYEIGKEYTEEGTINCCENGFHFCENPLDVLNYYGPVNSRYCEVEGSGEIDRGDNKVAVSHIRIGAELDFNGLAMAGINFILDKAKQEEAKTNGDIRLVARNNADCSAATNTGDSSVAANNGECSVATNTGYSSVATNTGSCSVATNIGDNSVAANTGYRSVVINKGCCSAATNTGDYSVATNAGEYSAVTNTGVCSVATNTGDSSIATNCGNYSEAKVSGKGSVAIVTGEKSKAAGAFGCWLVLTERDDDCNIVDIKSVKVDGEKIKPNTYYMLEGGEVVEVED